MSFSRTAVRWSAALEAAASADAVRLAHFAEEHMVHGAAYAHTGVVAGDALQAGRLHTEAALLFYLVT